MTGEPYGDATFQAPASKTRLAQLDAPKPAAGQRRLIGYDLQSLRPDHSMTTSAGKPGFMNSSALSIFTFTANTMLARSRWVML